MEVIQNYIPGLSSRQIEQFAQLDGLYKEWNRKINVISRKDEDNLFVHHILFSAGIARIFSFARQTQVMDAGTGGGFPGIPLAILFPETVFHLVDSIKKKIRVVEAISSELKLENVIPRCERIEEVRESFDFITGRALMPLDAFFQMVRKKIRQENRNSLPNGIIYLKGGDMAEERQKMTFPFDVYPLSSIFPHPFFKTKVIIHLHNF